MSEAINADQVTETLEPAKNPLRTELPCGCMREVVKVESPAFVDAPGTSEHGQAILDPAGGFKMQVTDQIVDRTCAEHTSVMIERQHAVAKALAEGVPPEQAARLMAGASPLLALESGEPSNGEALSPGDLQSLIDAVKSPAVA